MIPSAWTQTSHEFKLTGYFLKIAMSDFPDNMSWEELTLPDQWRLRATPWSPWMLLTVARRAAAGLCGVLPNRAFHLSWWWVTCQAGISPPPLSTVLQDPPIFISILKWVLWHSTAGILKTCPNAWSSHYLLQFLFLVFLDCFPRFLLSLSLANWLI